MIANLEAATLACDETLARTGSQQYLLEQTIRYSYRGSVTDLRQRLIVVPRERHGDQHRMHYAVTTSAPGARRHEHIDEFGNVVTDVHVDVVHDAIEFEVWALLRRQPEGRPHRERTWRGFAAPTRLTEPDQALREAARELASRAPAGIALVEHICDWVRSTMVYEDGVTAVDTTGAQALARERGVCQDFAHVMVTLCRLAGIPARYVSGHLLGEGGSHAWVEALVPDGTRTHSRIVHAFDPTEGCRTGPRHLTVAVGRDYADVAPMSGSYTCVHPGHAARDEAGGPRRVPAHILSVQAPETSRQSDATTPCLVGDLLDGYRPGPAWDEMFGAPDVPREHYRALHDLLGGLTDDEFHTRCIARDRALRDQGITFSYEGEERPFPLDLIPRIVPTGEWALIEAGVAQRVRALDAFLDDIYGPAHVLEDRILPRRLVTSSAHFHRQAAGFRPPNGVRVHVAGIDLVRDADGSYRVLEDNLRTPSGISYVVENRRIMTHVFPELFASHRVRPVGDYAVHLLEALRASASTQSSDPTIVVLSPGLYNAAYFEHAFLARRMGVELVEGRDLVCRDGVVYVGTTDGESPRRCRVPPRRRRVPRPAVLPPRLAHRVSRHHLCGPTRKCRDRQRGRQRRRRRQGGVPVRPRLDRVLPRGEADPRERHDVPARRSRPARARALTARPAGRETGRRIRRVRHRDRPGSERRGARRAGRVDRSRTPPLHRPGDRPAVDVAELRPRTVRAAPHRLAPLRRQRRDARVGGGGGPHPRRAARGQPHRELEPRWRIEGHVGPGRSGAPRRAGPAPSSRRPCRAATSRYASPEFGPTPEDDQQQQQQQQQQR